MPKKRFNEEIITEEVKEEITEETNNEITEETNNEIVEEVKEEITEETKTFLKLKKQFSSFKLNVRKEASASSEVIAQINNDDSIELVSDDINAEWYKVKVNNSIEGWVMSQYLEKSE